MTLPSNTDIARRNREGTISPRSGRSNGLILGRHFFEQPDGIVRAVDYAARSLRERTDSSVLGIDGEEV